jgi:LmbE family N-acetylglucosaminyl deacetylase
MISELLNSYSYARKVVTHGGYDYIYVSPHLDDVAFSCGGTICAHTMQGLHTLVVTLFAGDPQPPFSPLAQACHQFWQVAEDASPYQIRKMEDEQAMAALDVDYVWLNWLEVIYRLPDLTDFSDINTYHANDPILPALRQWLGDVHAAYPRAMIVMPLAIGGHQDHRVLFQAARDVLEHDTLLFYEDFPYVAYLPEEAKDLAWSHHLTPLEVDISHCLEQRIQVAGFYQSQLAMLFYPPSSFRDMIREYARVGETHRFVERYWKFSR